jgi:hypothetical protein
LFDLWTIQRALFWFIRFCVEYNSNKKKKIIGLWIKTMRIKSNQTKTMILTPFVIVSFFFSISLPNSS